MLGRGLWRLPFKRRCAPRVAIRLRSVAQAPENVDEEQIPRKYKESVKKYFGEMKSQGSGKADSESDKNESEESEDSSDDS